MDGRDGNAQRAGLVPVDVEPVLGHILHAVGPDLRQPRILRGHAQQLVAGGHQGLVAQTAAVLQLEVESLGSAQLDDGRGREGEDHRVAVLRELAHGPPGHGRRPSAPGRSRSSQSRSFTNAMPMFWPWPAKLEPETIMHDSTASFSSIRKWSRTRLMTFLVMSSVALAGRMAWTISMPWSSSGRYAVGMRRNRNTKAATIRAKMTR